MKKLVVLLCALLALGSSAQALEVSAPSALLMEKETGTVLFAKDEHAKLEPASVTKVMTLLLTMEAIDAGQLHYDDVVTASAHACSMGGSQIWLKENEQMTVSDMLKAVCVVSANDCAVALAETVALVEGLSLLFGAWLCFFVRESLPGYYDENRISFYGDGVFRMNLAGLRLNNSNWPHILAALRGWLLGTAAVFPLLWWGIWTLWPGTLQGLEGGLSLLACLGMFLPAYVVGKRYE